MKLKLNLSNPMDEDVNVILELRCLASNIKKIKMLGFIIIIIPLNIYLNKPTICSP
jgi:hypothetical protein